MWERRKGTLFAGDRTVEFIFICLFIIGAAFWRIHPLTNTSNKVTMNANGPHSVKDGVVTVHYIYFVGEMGDPSTLTHICVSGIVFINSLQVT